jgi:uncharacterized protein YjdB
VNLGRRLLTLGIVLPLAACAATTPGAGGSCTQVSVNVAQLKVFPDQLQIAAGESFQLATQAKNACGYQVTGAKLGWTSSNTVIATVNATGRVTGRVGGTVHITASVEAAPNATRQAAGGGGARGSASVTVSGFVIPLPPVDFVITVLPPNPVVAAGQHLQMTAIATDPQGNRVAGLSYVWISDRPDIASIDTNTGEVSAAVQGVAVITASVVGAAVNPMASTTLVVLDQNGGPMPPPNISVSPSGLVIAVGESRQVHATVTDSLTGAAITTPITWVSSASGVVTLAPVSADHDVMRVTGAATGSTELRAQATVDGALVESGPIGVRVLAVSPGVSTDWFRVQDLPYAGGIYGHEMSAVGDRLFLTGGVTGDVLSGGFREDVLRAQMLPDGSLQRAAGTPGWDYAPAPADPDPALRVLAPCVDDPHCMSILREATGTIPQRVVRYQVARHGQASTDTHVYVVGGIDAQVDLGIDPTDPGAVGPSLTRYSDRVLVGAVAADGTIAWHEDDRLPALTLSDGATDVPGRTAAALVRYRDWLYLLGGWNWVLQGTQFVGRNRDEILRAEIDPVTGNLSDWQLVGRLPEPLNKHAAAVAGDWLIVSGGSTGSDENSPELITDAVYIAQLDPATGDILAGAWRQTRSLPRPLEYHRMVALADDLRVVVVGGDDPNLHGASADAYLSEVDPATGLLKDWVFLPELPVSDGLTSLAAAAVGEVDGMAAFRVYVAGGGVPLGGDVTDLQRRKDVYFIDLLP